MIHLAKQEDLPAITALASQLWPDAAAEELEEGFSTLLSNPEAAVFLAFSNDHPAGFAQCQLRHDYVEGTDSSPVGYLEGIYVEEAHRRKGFARLLLAACEVWAREQGCTEFASDCELINTESLHFHLRLGFQEANRIICFTKKLSYSCHSDQVTYDAE